MAWSYDDYESQATDAARLAQAVLHHQEVVAEIRANSSIGDRSRQSNHLVEYLRILNDRIAKLRQSTGVGLTSDSPRVKGTFIRGRPI